MARNILWFVATVAVLALVLAYPTSANQGVPLGRTDDAAVVKTKKTPPSANRTAPEKPSPSR